MIRTMMNTLERAGTREREREGEGVEIGKQYSYLI